MESNIPLDVSLNNISQYFLINLLLFPIIYNALFYLNKLNIKLENTKRTKKQGILLWIFVFSIMILIWGSVAISFYPGNMTSDSIDQWAQAIGYYNIVDAHPPFHTIIMKLISFVWQSPMAVIIFNIIYFSSIFSFIMVYLYVKKGLPKSSIYIITIIFLLSINNISLVIVMWKDIPFTATFLWITFEIYKMIDQQSKYFKKKVNILSIVSAMVLINLLRANGLIQFISVLCVLIYFLFLYKDKKTKRMILCVVFVSSFTIFCITNYVYKFFNVQQSESKTPATYIFMAKGIASVTHYDENLSSETLSIANKMLPIEIIKKNYSPYNSDPYSFGTQNWSKGLQLIKKDEMYKVYFSELINNTKVIVRDRLDSSNLVWSYFTPDDGFNSTYVDGVWFPSSIDPSFLNLEYTDKENFVFLKNNNIVNSFFREYRDIINNNEFAYMIFWRVGISLSILLMICYLLLLKNKKLLLITFPVLIGILFWMLFMVHQSYRYVWFIYVNVFVILIIYFIENKKRGIKYETKSITNNSSL